MRIAFIWQGFDGRYGVWRDGLWAAMQLIEKEHEVKYFDFPLIGMEEFNPDVVLYWEAPCTINGKNADNYKAVCALPYRKALLFAGGPLKAMDVKDFDLVFVESEVNVDDCERQGIPYKKAFGTNTQIFKPERMTKYHDGFMAATFAGWKRHELFAEALGSKGTVAGRQQQFDTHGYNQCKKLGVTIFNEMSAENVAHTINASYSVVNTSNAEGGGQRCTVEGMACGVPVIVMSDSPKNCELVRASGGGIICEPTSDAIFDAVQEAKLHSDLYGSSGLAYIKSHLTEKHYADAIIAGIHEIQGAN